MPAPPEESDPAIIKILDLDLNLINSFSGKVIKVEEWGLINLTNKIRNYKKGFFIHFKFYCKKSF